MTGARTMIVALGALAAVTGLAACKPQVDCGDGTVTASGGCTQALAVSCGDGTKLIAGRCVPATGDSAECDTGSALLVGNTCYGKIRHAQGNVGRVVNFNSIEKPTSGPGNSLGDLADDLLNPDYVSGVHLVYYGFLRVDESIGFLYGGIGHALDGQLAKGIGADHAFAVKVTLDAGSDPPTYSSTDKVTFALGAFGNVIPLLITDTTFVASLGADPSGVEFPVQVKFSGVLNRAQADMLTVPQIGSTIGAFVLSQNYNDGRDLDGDGMADEWDIVGTTTQQAEFAF